MPVALKTSGEISYICVKPVSAEKAKRLIQDSINRNGGDGLIYIEQYGARVNDKFPQSFPGLKNQKWVFFCSSNDNSFSLGRNELMALQNEGIVAGIFRDSRGIVQDALESGRAKSK